MQFKTKSNEEIIIESIDNNNKYSKGDTIEIIYNKNDPDSFLINDKDAQNVDKIMLAILGFIFLLIVKSLLQPYWRKLKRKIKEF